MTIPEATWMHGDLSEAHARPRTTVSVGKSPCIKLSRNSPTASPWASNLRNDAPSSQIWRLG